MSVYVPIYHRILYGSSDSPAQEQCKQDLSSDKQLLPMDKNDNFVKVKMQPEIQSTTRQTMSAPLLPRGKNIGPRLLSSAPLTKSNGEHQSDRWKESERNLSSSRTLKRTSNIIPHRQDKGYYITGSRVPLGHKYDIDEEELIRLRMLAHSRAEKSTRGSSGNSSTLQRRINSGIRGQNSSPILPAIASETDKREDHLEKRNVTKEELREKQREMKRQKEREKELRFEEKAKFEREMEEKYKPKKPEQKSMIFVTENSNHGSKQKQRVFLTERDFLEEEKAAVYSFINEKQRNAFTSIFNDLDKSKDGKVDMAELKQQLFPLVSKENLKYLLQVFDLDKNHTVDVREFVTICALNDKLCGIRTESETASLALDLERLAEHITIYKELFNVVDEDGDGRLQADEVLLMVTTATEGETDEIDVDESKRILDSIEKDENGFIDFVSFLSYIPFFAKLLKMIMDSPLSITSLERVREKVTRKYSRNETHSS